jgi:predicted acetylornithine/succinylornithine family transaminase
LTKEEIILAEKKYHIQTYPRYPVVFVRGKGIKVWDSEGKEYYDFIAGLGVVNVGHSHPEVIQAIKEQLSKLFHVSNLFYTEPQVKLAEMLISRSFAGQCFFCNSGAEANEAAIKLARRYAKVSGKKGWQIITAFRSFHGRTMMTLAATGQRDKQTPFEPLPLGFKHIPLNDFEALRKAISDETCAIMLEPIQGEGGVYPCEEAYLQKVKNLCEQAGILLILDEVQTGIGRTGKFFAYEHYGVKPDIITLAKGLGGGLPIGAVIARTEVAKALGLGEHGSTFGGGPVVASAACATLKVIEDEKLIENAKRVGRYLAEGLQKLAAETGAITQVRGKGLMQAATLREARAKEIVKSLLEGGIIINSIGQNILRFLPPLCVKESDIELMLNRLKATLNKRS